MTRLVPALAVNPCKIICPIRSQAPMKYTDRGLSSAFCFREFRTSAILTPAIPARLLCKTFAPHDVCTDTSSRTQRLVFLCPSIIIYCTATHNTFLCRTNRLCPVKYTLHHRHHNQNRQHRPKRQPEPSVVQTERPPHQHHNRRRGKRRRRVVMPYCHIRPHTEQKHHQRPHRRYRKPNHKNIQHQKQNTKYPANRIRSRDPPQKLIHPNPDKRQMQSRDRQNMYPLLKNTKKSRSLHNTQCL